MGSIFMRLQVFGKTRAAGLLGEVERLGWASGHVEVPQEARRLFGPGFEKLLGSILIKADAAREVTTGGVSRRIRPTQGVVMGVIASLPLEAALCRTDPAIRAYCDRWLEATSAWVVARWGEDVVAAYAHEDESRFHVHYIIVPHDEQMLARALHPGLHVKREAETAARRDGMDAGTARRAGSTANTAALNRLLDEYHQDVGRNFGLARTLGGKGSVPPWVQKALKKAAAESQRLAIENERLRLANASARALHAEFEEKARQLEAEIALAQTGLEAMRQEAQTVQAEAQSRADLLIAEATRAADEIRDRAHRDAEAARAKAGAVEAKAKESLAKAEAARRTATQAAAADQREAVLALAKAETFGARVAVVVDSVTGHGRRATDEVRATADAALHAERRLRKGAEERIDGLLARQTTLSASLKAAERVAADERRKRLALQAAVELNRTPRIPEHASGPHPG